MKAIMISIKPKWCAEIMNGNKTIEVRRKFPKDYVGWVYIYCSKNDDLGCIKKISKDKYVCGKKFDINDFNYLASGYNGKGKVVARFYCDNVKAIKYGRLDNYEFGYFTDKNTFNNICKLAEESCLELWEIDNYLQEQNGYAIHISDLEIFDKPKELSEFKKNNSTGNCWKCKLFGSGCSTCQLTKAPQNFCYVEVE